MLRTLPELSKAKLRDAELADAEQKLEAARQQLAGVRAEIARSRELLDAISANPERAETGSTGAGPQYDGAVAAFALGRRRNSGMPEGNA